MTPSLPRSQVPGVGGRESEEGREGERRSGGGLGRLRTGRSGLVMDGWLTWDAFQPSYTAGPPHSEQKMRRLLSSGERETEAAKNLQYCSCALDHPYLLLHLHETDEYRPIIQTSEQRHASARPVWWNGMFSGRCFSVPSPLHPSSRSDALPRQAIQTKRTARQR